MPDFLFAIRRRQNHSCVELKKFSTSKNVIFSKKIVEKFSADGESVCGAGYSISFRDSRIAAAVESQNEIIVKFKNGLQWATSWSERLSQKNC